MRLRSFSLGGCLLACSIVAGCGGGGVPNAAPMANAGADQTVFSGATVTLDASQSSDPEGDPQGYLWSLASKPPGSAALLSNPTAASPTFVADLAGTYAVSLTVNDGRSSSSPDVVIVTATANPWTLDAPMPTPRDRVSAAAVGTRIYVMGGESAGVPVGAVEVFDTMTHTWSTAPSLPTPRSTFAIAVVGATIFTIGGGPAVVGGPTSLVEALDTSTGTWTTKAAMPTQRTLAAASASGGTVFVAGGYRSPGTCFDWVCKGVAAVESYDPGTDTWTTRPSLPRAKIGLGAAALNNTVYAIGGERQDGIVIGAPSSDAYRYDIALGAWSAAAPMPVAVSSPSVVASSGKLFVLAAPVLAFDPASGAWTAMTAPSPGAAAGPIAAETGGKIYVFKPATTLVYDPANDRP